MHNLLVLVTLISAVLGGTLQVIDYKGQCFVYSTENFDCTGISEPFAHLDGTSCCNLNTDDKVTHSNSSAFKAKLCGSSQNSAWVEVHQNGLLFFHNDKADEAKCKVDGGLVKGGLCTATNSSSSSTRNSKPQSTSSDTKSSDMLVTEAASTPTMSSGSESPSNSITDC
ncbi:hypothetical protein N7481_010191 [Penicillium waksmanii]|uniref:uncharacterized protein n=1 Tax=Penicillium waksmanii TaxID=69791 RepID=UPI00254698CE|nr:uncharacterized protein N7481_010191 [Penicillium waksmanii]KAJ5976484.1 hypothetical protein N7481_010191 [Penicillium waksmanii]